MSEALIKLSPGIFMSRIKSNAHLLLENDTPLYSSCSELIIVLQRGQMLSLSLS